MHDFRRTAARKLLRAGIDQSTAMAILGHETAEIFRRYAIKDVLREAADKLSQAGYGLLKLQTSYEGPGSPSRDSEASDLTH